MEKIFWLLTKARRPYDDEARFVIESQEAIDFDPLACIAELEKESAAWQSDAYYQRSQREVFTARYDALAAQVLDLREELIKRDAQIEEMGDLIDRQSNEIDEMRAVYSAVGDICAEDLRGDPWNTLRMVVETYIKGA